MRYWVKTHNHLDMHKKIFSEEEAAFGFIKNVIEESKLRYQLSKLKEISREIKISDKERDEKISVIKAWKGFSLTELVGNDNNLGSIIIVAMKETEFDHENWFLEDKTCHK